MSFSHNRDWDSFDRSIDIRITRLRRKIEVEPSRPRIIKTVRGAGYIRKRTGAPLITLLVNIRQLNMDKRAQPDDMILPQQGWHGVVPPITA